MHFRHSGTFREGGDDHPSPREAGTSTHEQLGPRVPPHNRIPRLRECRRQEKNAKLSRALGKCVMSTHFWSRYSTLQSRRRNVGSRPPIPFTRARSSRYSRCPAPLKNRVSASQRTSRLHRHLDTVPTRESDDASNEIVYYLNETWGLAGQRVSRNELLLKTTTSGSAGPSMHAVVRVCRPSTVLQRCRALESGMRHRPSSSYGRKEAPHACR